MQVYYIAVNSDTSFLLDVLNNCVKTFFEPFSARSLYSLFVLIVAQMSLTE